MDSTLKDWVDYDSQREDSSDDDFSDGETPAAAGERGIYNDPAAFFASMGMANPNLPIPVLKSAKDVRVEAKGRSRNIGASYKTLHAIVERHEATIQRRWANKTKQQRLKTLLAA